MGKMPRCSTHLGLPEPKVVGDPQRFIRLAAVRSVREPTGGVFRFGGFQQVERNEGAVADGGLSRLRQGKAPLRQGEARASPGAVLALPQALPGR
jgi:hypothetical protein